MCGKFILYSLIAIALFIVSGAAELHAAEQQGPPSGFGLRAGLGLDPDQFVIGGQALLGRKLKIFRFGPSLDFGFGSDLTTVALNLDLLLDLKPPGAQASFYGGFGPGVVGWYPKGGDSDLEVGISLVAGVRLPLGSRNLYNLETRFGLSDIPDFRLLFGVLFGAASPPLPPPAPANQ